MFNLYIPHVLHAPGPGGFRARPSEVRFALVFARIYNHAKFKNPPKHIPMPQKSIHQEGMAFQLLQSALKYICHSKLSGHYMESRPLFDGNPNEIFPSFD